MQRKLERLGAVHLRAALQPHNKQCRRHCVINGWKACLLLRKQNHFLEERRTRSQRKLLRALESHGKGVLVRDLLEETGTTALPLKTLEEKGLVRFSEAHQPQSAKIEPHDLPPLDSPEQEQVWQTILELVSSPEAAPHGRSLVVMDSLSTGANASPWSLPRTRRCAGTCVRLPSAAAYSQQLCNAADCTVIRAVFS